MMLNKRIKRSSVFIQTYQKHGMGLSKAKSHTNKAGGTTKNVLFFGFFGGKQS